jgi:hypothetical protein
MLQRAHNMLDNCGIVKRIAVRLREDLVRSGACSVARGTLHKLMAFYRVAQIDAEGGHSQQHRAK